jgi:hypothetical protein
MRWIVALLLALFCIPGAQAQNKFSSSYPVVSTADTNSTLIVGPPGGHYIYGFSLGNTGAAAWVKVYSTTTAPTCGSGTPVAVFPVPGNSLLAGSNVTLPFPILIPSGIGYCITGAATNSDTTAVTAAQVAGTIYYH